LKLGFYKQIATGWSKTMSKKDTQKGHGKYHFRETILRQEKKQTIIDESKQLILQLILKKSGPTRCWEEKKESFYLNKRETTSLNRTPQSKHSSKYIMVKNMMQKMHLQ
jgi:hypothetical protein